MNENIVWTVTLLKSYVDLQFDFEDPNEAEDFSRTAAKYYRADDEKFSVSITAKFAENVTAEAENDDDSAEAADK